MEASVKTIGERLRRIFTGVVGRPIGWSLIDALALIEDREEAIRSDEEEEYVPSFTVQQGKRYRATILLNWLERLASNETVAEKLRELGFSDVQVTGQGSARSADALWAAADATAEIPTRIKSIKEVEA